MIAALLSRRRWLLAIVLSVGLAACGGSDDDGPAPTPPVPPTPTVKADTTLLVYTLGSDLESVHEMASLNISEMSQATPSDRVNVVLTTGGADKDGWRTLRRQIMRDQKLQELEDLGPVNMADPATLTAFIDWGMQQYPAERYLLVFWNHGGGPNGGFGKDENFEDAVMSLPQIQQALRNVGQGANGGAHFDMIGFDACLMASVEVADALAPHANYLLASQEVEPGPGWDWTVLLQNLADTPTIDIPTLGERMVDGYLTKLEHLGSSGIATLSIIDLAQIGPLVAALERVSNTLSARLTDEGNAAWFDIAYSRRNAADFTSPRFFGGATDLVDIGDFMVQPPMILPEHQLAEVEQALAAAVLYQRYGEDRIPTSGLSMFFPVKTLTSAHTLATYDGLDFSATQRAFVARYAAQAQQLPRTVLGQPQIKGASIQATLSQSALTPFGAMMNDDGVIYALKPADGMIEFDPANPEQMAVAAQPEGTWFALGGQPVLLLPDDHQFAADSGRFSVPVLLYASADSDPITQGFLEVEFEQPISGPASYRITSFTRDYGNHSLVAARPMVLPAGLFVQPLSAKLDEDGEWRLAAKRGGPLVPSGDMAGNWQLEVITGAPGPLQDFRLGVLDYLAQMQLSPALP